MIQVIFVGDVCVCVCVCVCACVCVCVRARVHRKTPDINRYGLVRCRSKGRRAGRRTECRQTGKQIDGQMQASTQTQTRRCIITRMDTPDPRPRIDGLIMTVSRPFRDGAEKGRVSIHGSAARDRWVAPCIRGIDGSLLGSAARDRSVAPCIRGIDGSLLGSAGSIGRSLGPRDR